MTKKQIYKTLTNLSQEKLNTIDNKKTYVKNDVMTIIIKCCRAEKKRGMKAIDGFRNKLMIPDFEVPECPEFNVKLKIRKILKNYKLKNILLRFIKLILICISTYEKIQVDNNRCKYILFRTDVYFIEHSLAVEIDEKGHTDRDFNFEVKRQKALEKKLGCKFIRINTSNAKNGYDLDYEVGNTETFIDEFKNKKIKELEKEMRETRNEKLKNKN